MLTKLIVRNFKKLKDAEIPLDRSVVLIGPNNSGKTTALQALTLWDIGLKEWLTKRGNKALPEKRPGVLINRKDLAALPVPNANLLWNDLHVRGGHHKEGARHTKNVRIDIIVEGITDGLPWSCGLEFDYSNEESFICRPLRLPGHEDQPVRSVKFSTIPPDMARPQIAYLPPMSGMADREYLKQAGEINILIGQGQTAQVLRNLCYRIVIDPGKKPQWEILKGHILQLFGVTLCDPVYHERSEITLEYREQSGALLDISCAGRGLQQTILLLAHLHANPGTVLLLDEPDAHLEILRQRQTYNLITEVAEQQGSQVIAASHSEVVLNEAANRGRVVAFVGKPHVLNDRGSQLVKSLTEIGWDQYYQAERMGWILYLESLTDLDILRSFACKLGHPAGNFLQTPFINPVATNLPQKARDNFYALREAMPSLVGIAIFDRLDKTLQSGQPLVELMWQRREIENYFCTEDVLLAYAQSNLPDDLLGHAQKQHATDMMRESIAEVSRALKTLSKGSPWSHDLKVTDDFLDPLFKAFSEKMKTPLVLRKNEYHKLVEFMPASKIGSEVNTMLDAIVTVAKQAQPAGD